MAKESASSSRKRTHPAEDDGAASSKRSNRQPSPSKQDKHVEFKRRLESGPTTSRADHRHQSPARPAIRQNEVEEAGEYSDDDGGDDASDASVYSAGDDDNDSVRAQPDREGYTGVEDGIERLDVAPPGEWTPGVDIGVGHAVKPPKANATSPKKTAKPAAKRVTSSGDEAKDDVSVCNAIHELRDAVKAFANDFPMPASDVRDPLAQLLSFKNEKTVRYIGCLALGGKGRESWEKLLRDQECRKAVVFGMIGRALKESVFGELWFGATEEQQKELSELEQSSVDLDGFHRTTQRAELCIKYQKAQEKDQASTISEMKAKARVTVQLAQLLGPLATTSDSRRQRTQARGAQQVPLDLPRLGTIVSMASDLSRSMRCMSDVVYYWPPTFKDEEFEPGRMEANNLRYMIEKSPYEKKELHGRVRAVLQPGQQDCSEAIVRVMYFPGLVAYRQGGGELGKRLLAEEGHRERNSHKPTDVRYVEELRSRHDGITVHSGFRSKVIGKAVVHLLWGKQRLLTKEAGTSAHLDAMRDHSNKYEEDRKDFVELWDLYVKQNQCLNCSALGHKASACTQSRSTLFNRVTGGTKEIEKPGKA